MDRRWLIPLLTAALLTGCAAPPDASAENAPPPESSQEEPVPEPVPKAPPERLLKEVHYGSDGTAVYTTTYFYDAAGNCVLERTEGENITNIDGERDFNETVNVYNEQGNCAKEQYVDAEGEVIFTIQYEYGPVGADNQFTSQQGGTTLNE